MDVLMLVGGGAVLVLFAAIFLVSIAFLRKAGPNEVIVVSGRGGISFISGGAGVVIPLFNTWNSLSLEVMTLEVTTPEVYTSQGVPVAVDGVAQIKIMKDEASLHAAAERFLGKATEEIAKIALETVQGHLRAILGTLSVEEIYQKRETFADRVREISGEDLKKMGLGIDSFQIRDIRDKHGYLEALGRPQIAAVKQTAAIAEKEAEKQTREKAAEADRLAQEAEAKSHAAIAEANADKDRRTQEAEASAKQASEIKQFQALQAIASEQKTANLKKAEADMAYEIQKKTMEIQLQEQEILRRKKELDATVRSAADAKAYEIETLAHAEQKRVETLATADKNRVIAEAEGRKAQGLAEAAVNQARGLAEAESKKAQGLAEALTMEKKAEAWQKYSEAAVLQILAPILPEIAKAIATPLANIDKITLINTGGDGEVGASRLTGDVARMIAQVPPVVESLTGIKMDQMIGKLSGRTSGAPVEEPPKKKA